MPGPRRLARQCLDFKVNLATAAGVASLAFREHTVCCTFFWREHQAQQPRCICWRHDAAATTRCHSVGVLCGTCGHDMFAPSARLKRSHAGCKLGHVPAMPMQAAELPQVRAMPWSLVRSLPSWIRMRMRMCIEGQRVQQVIVDSMMMLCSGSLVSAIPSPALGRLGNSNSSKCGRGAYLEQDAPQA